MSILKFTGTGTGTEFSNCGRYKYCEYARWNLEGPAVMFVLLNPSNNYKEKAQITRCIEFARFWGFGQAYITYLFSYITPYPQQLSRAASNRRCDIIGPENNLEAIGAAADMVVFAWGPYGIIAGRDKQVINLFPENGHYIELSVVGYPREPATLKRLLLPQRYNDADCAVS